MPLSQILHDGSATYVYGTPAERLFAQQNSVKTWYSTDALNSVRALLDDAGLAQAGASYDAWGIPETPSIAPFGFTGELQRGNDVWLRARWYGAGRGAFGAFRWQTSEVDNRIPLSHHGYVYASNNPSTWTDPTGRCVPWIDVNGQPISGKDFWGGHWNWDDGKTYWNGVADTAYSSVVGPVELVYRVATEDEAHATVRRGWNYLHSDFWGAAATVADAAMAPFTEIYDGITCRDTNKIGRGLTGYAFLLTGARLGRAGSKPTFRPISWRKMVFAKEQGGGWIGKSPTSVTAAVSLEDEIAQAAGAVDRNGYTYAGRSLRKHSDRVGSKWPKPTSKKPLDYNLLAQNLVEDILTNPKTTLTLRQTASYGSVVRIESPLGQVIFYSIDMARFIGFRE